METYEDRRREVEFQDLGETHFVLVKGHRKGRGQRPCEVSAGVVLDEPGQVVLRTFDESGVCPIVLVLGADEAELLGAGIAEAVAKARAAQ